MDLKAKHPIGVYSAHQITSNNYRSQPISRWKEKNPVETSGRNIYHSRDKTKQDVGSCRCLSMSLKRSPSTWPATVLPDQRTPTFYLTPRDRNVCGHQNFGIPFFQSLDPSLKNQWLKRKQLDAHNRIYRQWGMTVTGKMQSCNNSG